MTIEWIVPLQVDVSAFVHVKAGTPSGVVEEIAKAQVCIESYDPGVEYELENVDIRDGTTKSGTEKEAEND